MKGMLIYVKSLTTKVVRNIYNSDNIHYSYSKFISIVSTFLGHNAFSALMLLVRQQEGHLACKTRKPS